MSVKIKVEGIEELQDALDDMSKDAEKAVSKGIAKTVIEARNFIVKKIQAGGTGRVYQKYNPSRTHQASSPGEAPATDTGKLVNSVYMETKPLEATVGSRLAYAKYLEFGTFNMQPRPVWLPAGEDAAKNVTGNIEHFLGKVLK